MNEIGLQVPADLQALFDSMSAHPIMALVLLALAVAVMVAIRQAVQLVYEVYRAGLRLAPRKHAHGIIAGKYGPLRVYSPEKKEAHTACIGGSGSGKTSAVLIPTLRSWQGHFFAIDISGDISSNVTEEDAVTYEPLSESTPPYDVFAWVDNQPTYGKQIEALINISLMLIPARESSGTSLYYEKAGRDVLCGVLIAGYEYGMAFGEIADYVANHDFKAVLDWISDSGNTEAQQFIMQFQGIEDSQQSNAVQGASEALLLFTKPAIRHAIGSGGDALTPTTIEERSIFFRIPDQVLEQYSPLIDIVVSQMLDYLSNRPAERKTKLLLALDEYSSFHIDVSAPLAKVRKRNCRIMLLFQSLAQLDRNYGEAARREMMDNCALTILCNVSEPESQKYFSDKIGTRYEKQKTRNKDSELTSTTEVEKPIIRPEELGRLRTHAIVLSGGYALRVKKAYFFKRW